MSPLRWIGMAAALAAAPSPAPGQAPDVTWVPARPQQGSLIRVRVVWPGASALRAHLAGEPVHFEQDSTGAFNAVAALPADAGGEVGGWLWRDGEADSVPLAVPVAERAVRSERLRMASQYTEPPDSALAARIAGERAQIRRVLEGAHDEPRRWSLWFSPPRRSAVTSPYGTRRVLNGETRSRHLGLDYQGQMGDPVRASNDGEVVLVGDFFYNGRCIYLSHGAGLVTVYLHLSAVDVAVGDRVVRGQVIGRVGASGRVTGPHLHWSVLYGRISADPMSLLALRPLPSAAAGGGDPVGGEGR